MEPTTRTPVELYTLALFALQADTNEKKTICNMFCRLSLKKEITEQEYNYIQIHFNNNYRREGYTRLEPWFPQTEEGRIQRIEYLQKIIQIEIKKEKDANNN